MITEFTFLAAINPNLPKFVLLGIIIIVLGAVLRYFRQPYVIAYILAGVFLGEHGFEIVTDRALIHVFGEFGLILLLFFIGMEIDLQSLIKDWKLSFVGTGFQVLGSILIIGVIGLLFNWQINRIIILGFVISLSSSAVVIKLLQDSNETTSAIGQNVISILIVQDVLIVPMLIATNYLGGNIPDWEEIIRQIVGGTLIIACVLWVVRKKEISLPFSKQIEMDHELQVFIAFIFCFGFALITAMFGLSGALGAFVGGIIIHASKSTAWFHDSLHSFRVIFVALFFVSIGMLIDLKFLFENKQIVALIILAVYLSNHFINTLILRYFGRSWKLSIYGGSLLAQVGELSFILVGSAFYFEIITDFTYQLTIVVVSLTLLISPFWIAATKKLMNL